MDYQEQGDDIFQSLGRQIAGAFREMFRTMQQPPSPGGMVVSQLPVEDAQPIRPDLPPLPTGEDTPASTSMEASFSQLPVAPALDTRSPASFNALPVPSVVDSPAPTRPATPDIFTEPGRTVAPDIPDAMPQAAYEPAAAADPRRAQSVAPVIPDLENWQPSALPIPVSFQDSRPSPSLPDAPPRPAAVAPISPADPEVDPIRSPSRTDPLGYGKFRQEMSTRQALGSQAHTLSAHAEEESRQIEIRDEQDRQYRDLHLALMTRVIKDVTMDNRRLSDLERSYAMSRESVADVNL